MNISSIIIIMLCSIIISTIILATISYAVHCDMSRRPKKVRYGFMIVVLYFNSICDAISHNQSKVTINDRYRKSIIIKYSDKKNFNRTIIRFHASTIEIGEVEFKLGIIDWFKYCIWLYGVREYMIYHRSNIIINHIMKWNNRIVQQVNLELAYGKYNNYLAKEEEQNNG